MNDVLHNTTHNFEDVCNLGGRCSHHHKTPHDASMADGPVDFAYSKCSSDRSKMVPANPSALWVWRKSQIEIVRRKFSIVHQQYMRFSLKFFMHAHFFKQLT